MTKPSWQDFGTHDESAYPELWDGVIGAWAPCLGPTGSRLHDMSRRSNWGTLTNMDNATDWVVSNGQYALNMNGPGSSMYVDVGTLQNDAIAYPFSMACWVRNVGTAVDTSPFAKSQQSASYAGPMIWIDGGVAKAYWAAAARATGSTTVGSRSFWSLLGICWTGAEAQVIIDGRIDGRANTSVAPNGANQAVNIGRYGTNPGLDRTMSGQVDDCTIWRRCLSPSEWRQLYQLGRGGMYQRRRRRAIYLPQAGFQPAWALRRSQVIGGGLR